jgi:hypothetical protein
MNQAKHEPRQETKLLPLIDIDGTEFLVDVERRHFRNFRDAEDVIPMHSQQGRQIIKSMHQMEWRSFALDSCLPNTMV